MNMYRLSFYMPNTEPRAGNKVKKKIQSRL